MNPCPNCNCHLESWEVTCHSCDAVVSQEAVPIVSGVPSPERELQESFDSWLTGAQLNLRHGKYEEAAASLTEALKRLKGLANGEAKELEVRQMLAETLKKAEKFSEAGQQYLLLSHKTASLELQKTFLKNAQELQQSAIYLALTAPISDNFESVIGAERPLVPLYCGLCKRLLNEAEVYGFRKGVAATVRCQCGFDGQPLARHDAKHMRALKNVEALHGRKAKLIEAASKEYAHGKKRITAALLAIFLGVFGIHKFYLGERNACLVYILFSWTLIPWLIALFEAVNYLSMSQVTFNLNYNVDLVLKEIPVEEVPGSTHDEVFSMDITEDPEDFIDELSDLTPR